MLSLSCTNKFNSGNENGNRFHKHNSDEYSLALKIYIQTFPNDTRALGSNSQWYVASFAIAVTTKHRSLDCDNFLKVWLLVPKADSCLSPRRLHKQTQKK